MATDKDQKTEHPTETRRGEARREGSIARSRELAVALSLVAGFLVLLAAGRGVWSTTQSMMRDGLLRVARPQDVEAPSTVGAVTALASDAGGFLLAVTSPVLSAVALAVVVAFLSQGVFGVYGSLVAPDIGRLSPVRGAAKLFSVGSTLRGLLGGAKLVVVAFFLFGVLQPFFGAAATDGATPDLFAKFGLRTSLALVSLAAFDYALQRWSHTRSLRMSPQEVREEYQQLEGDPGVKVARRRLWQQLLRGESGLSKSVELEPECPESGRPESELPKSGRPKSGRPESGLPKSGRPWGDGSDGLEGVRR